MGNGARWSTLFRLPMGFLPRTWSRPWAIFRLIWVHYTSWTNHQHISRCCHEELHYLLNTVESLEKHQTAWLNAAAEAWRPMEYRAEGTREGENLVRLNVMYHDPLKNNSADLRFRLVAIDSK